MHFDENLFFQNLYQKIDKFGCFKSNNKENIELLFEQIFNLSRSQWQLHFFNKNKYNLISFEHKSIERFVISFQNDKIDSNLFHISSYLDIANDNINKLNDFDNSDSVFFYLKNIMPINFHGLKESNFVKYEYIFHENSIHDNNYDANSIKGLYFFDATLRFNFPKMMMMINFYLEGKTIFKDNLSYELFNYLYKNHKELLIFDDLNIIDISDLFKPKELKLLQFTDFFFFENKKLTQESKDLLKINLNF